MPLNEKVKVRVAPSPTGFLHIGTAQSALYNWLFAKKNGGKFYVRIEDTDRERSTKEYEQSIFNALHWLGLEPDNTEPIRQSERMDLYKKYLDRLVSSGNVRRVETSEEDKEKIKAEGKTPSDVVFVLDVDAAGQPVVFEDTIRGSISVERKEIGSQIIARILDKNKPDDIIFLYNFTVVVDDIEMQITDVIRGEDHISNTPKQILIYEALGESHPSFAHLPLILASDRSKLSKRHGATAVVDYKKDYLPEALLNFLGTLGYTFDQEILTKEEMVSQFNLAKVHKAGAVFDVKKLGWINAQYIKKLTAEGFKKVLKEAGYDFADQIPDVAVPLITERLEKLSDTQEFSYLWQKPEYNTKMLLWKTSSSEEVKNVLEQVAEIIDQTGALELKEKLEQLAEKVGNKGLVFWPLRVALSGKEKSPDPIQIALALEKNEILQRVRTATGLLDES
jgi:glutamyl/glutaminyl-tRNA synthetase